jgi:hypothetical protein
MAMIKHIFIFIFGVCFICRKCNIAKRTTNRALGTKNLDKLNLVDIRAETVHTAQRW